jgi:hypothetical protein
MNQQLTLEDEMSQDQTQRLSASPLNMVVGGAGIGLLIAAAAVAYLRSNKEASESVGEAFETAKANTPLPFTFKGRWALNTTISLIEHETSRKLLLSVLKAMAKKSR